MLDDVNQSRFMWQRSKRRAWLGGNGSMRDDYGTGRAVLQ
jgi:hypothetical protein